MTKVIKTCRVLQAKIFTLSEKTFPSSCLDLQFTVSLSFWIFNITLAGKVSIAFLAAAFQASWLNLIFISYLFFWLTFFCLDKQSNHISLLVVILLMDFPGLSCFIKSRSDSDLDLCWNWLQWDPIWRVKHSFTY